MLRKLLPLFLAALALAQAPQVTKVEPPNWFAGLPAPMLLLYGSNLAHAHAIMLSAPPGVSIAQQRPGNDGLYYFLYLAGTEHAQPGNATIRLSSPTGTETLTFSLQPRTAPQPQPLTGKDVLYLIMPDRFADRDLGNDHPANSVPIDRSQPRAYHGGDLAGIEAHLPYLRQLGVTILWLTPVVDNANDSPGDYHGYSATDLYAVDEHLGTLAAYRHLIITAREEGIRVYADYVPNHVGPKHPWVAHPPQGCWLNGTLQHHDPFSDNFRVLTDPHATASEQQDTVKGWFFDVLPDMDNDCPDVERYQTENAMWWIETAAIDGFRIDTFPYSSRSFWAKWHADMRRVYPRLSDVGEVLNSQSNDPVITSFFQGGRTQFDGIDTQLTTLFDGPMQNAVRSVLLKGAPASQLADVLSHDWLYPHPEALVTYFGNHDMDRFMSESGASPRALKLAFAILATMRGTPEIYSGDEVAMQGGGDPDNRRDFPGGFPGDAANDFSAAGRTGDAADIHDFVAAAMAFRHAHPALIRGDLQHAVISDTIYAFTRSSGTDKLLIVINPTTQPQQVALSSGAGTALASASSLTQIFAMTPGSVPPIAFTGTAATLTAAPQSVTVYQVN